MFPSLLLASRIDVLFKRMYLKKMTALSDFSAFLQTGNLSSLPDDEHSSTSVAAAWSGSSLRGVHLPRQAREFPDPLKRGRGQRDKLLRVPQHVRVT